MDSTSGKLPSHLEPLLQPTPSGVAKLLAAWDGLLVETQIDILTRLPDLPAYLASRVKAKALESQTPYVRYLAYRGDRLADMAVIARLEADPDPLVRHSTKETRHGFSDDKELDDPEKFLAMPHEANGLERQVPFAEMVLREGAATSQHRQRP